MCVCADLSYLVTCRKKCGLNIARVKFAKLFPVTTYYGN